MHSPPEVYEIPYEAISDTETVFSETATKLLEKACWLAENKGELTGEESMRVFMSSDELEEWMTMCDELDFLGREPEKRYDANVD